MADVTPQTIPTFLADTLARRPNEPALGFIRGGQLEWRTWREVADDAQRQAEMICAAGVLPGDRVAQVSENRYEWVITDLALHLAGAVHVPMHISLSGQQLADQIADCGARLAFVSSNELLAKFAGMLDNNVSTIVHDASPSPQSPAPSPQPPVPSPQPHALATILYTSGTTGRPRGVMLSQRNLASNAAALADAHGGNADETRLCILPLSHIYARTCDLYTWVYLGSRLVLAESRETLARDCQLARPTSLSAVPYFYQRISERIRAGGAADEAGAVRDFFGGRIERLYSGGAPLAPDTEAWYFDCGLPILPGYGLTETSPVLAVSTPTAHRLGSVGPPLPGVEVQIADDGEILVRGPNVMLGYWHDKVATADMLCDGWLYTGDLGELDADGFLFVRGRKKELIVLSTGKKVVPTRVENLLTSSPHIEQAAVFGDGQCALVALIVPTARRSAPSSRPRGGLTESEERGARSEFYSAEISRCLQAAAHEEQVRQFTLLDRAFSIEHGELTPKLSLCRKVIAGNFNSELNHLYTALRSDKNHKGTKNTKAAVGGLSEADVCRDR